MSTSPNVFRRVRTQRHIGFLALVTFVSLMFVLLPIRSQIASADTPDSPPADPPETSFDFAVVPDTQNEVFVDGTPLLTGRYQWLSDNKDALNLKFIEQTGDLVNWGVADPIQFTRASLATNILDNSGIPYGYTIGNHDGAAVKVGGSAAPGNVRDNLRNTTVFNQFFPVSRFKDVQGTFEPNKVDNMYQTFTAGGVNWLVLTHEMWPREAVIQWMRGVVASHPTFNVIISTHAYTDQAGNLQTSGNYGDQNALVEWQEFISQYPNIKFVVSGHYGDSTQPVINAGYSYSEQTGLYGNKVAQIMTAYHSNVQNQTRLLHIDTVAGTISSSVYVANSTNPAYPTGYITDGASNFVTTGMNWVQPDGSTPAPILTAPSAPNTVSATAGNGSATVSFATPSSDGGAPITSYTATSTPGNVTVTGGASPISVSGLTNGTSYTFTVQATNIIGTGPPSASTNSVTPQVPTQAPELLVDPGFEGSGFGGWSAFVVGNVVGVGSPVHGGVRAVKVSAVASTSNLVGLSQNSVIANSVSGRQYSAQCWVNPTSAGLGVQMRFLQYTQNFGANTNLNSVVVSSLPANTWTLVKVTGVATQNGYRVIPQIYSSNETTKTGSIIYDDCSVY
jgi:Fibronectin type III domain/Calcineurin-like phosphoesterase